MSEQPSKINWWVPAGVLVAVFTAYVFPAVKMWMSKPTPPPVPRQLTTTSGMSAHPSFSPNGSAVVLSSNRSGHFELYVKQLADSAERQLTSDGKGNVEPVWSPDGTTIAYRSEQGGLYVIPAAGGSSRQVTPKGQQPAWWPDSTRIVFVDQGRLWVVPLSGEPQPFTEAGKPEGEHSSPRFHPDKRHIGFLSGKRLWEFDVETKELTQVTEGDPSPQSFVYGVDGLAVYLLASAGKKVQGLYLLHRDPQTRRPIAAPETLSEGEGAMLRDLEIDSSHKRLAYTYVTAGTESNPQGNVYVAELPAK